MITSLKIEPTNSWVYFGLLRGVNQVDQIIENPASYNLIFLNVDMIYSKEHLLLAMTHTLEAIASERKRTKFIGTELCYRLSPYSNISEALKTFGIKRGIQNVLAVRIVESSLQGSHDDFQEEFIKLQSTIGGEFISMDELDRLKNTLAIRKFYKIPDNLRTEVQVLNFLNGNVALKSLELDL